MKENGSSLSMHAGFSRLGFSVLEIMITVAALGILAAISVSFSSRLYTSVEERKLEKDVKTINSAIEIYLHNGGDLSDVSDPQSIVDKLKTTRSDASTGSFVGLTGSTIDPRLAVRMHRGEKPRPAAVWNSDTQQFEVRQQAESGVASFVLDETLASADYGTEQRAESILSYDTKPGWIWAYEDQAASPPEGPTSISVSTPPDTTLPPPPRKLDPPLFDLSPGSYPESDFPMTLSLSNPNAPDTWIMYSVNGGTFLKYSSPITISDTASVFAYTIGDPDFWVRSNDRYAGYTALPAPPPVQLVPPIISTSDTQFTDSVREISVSITNPNPSASSTLYYSLVANGDPHPDPSIWTPYTGTLLALADDYPSGFSVTSYAKSNNTEKFLDSPSTTRETTADFFGIPITGDILFIVDASSSMNQSFGDSTRFEVTIKELTKAIQTLPSRIRFNVAMFDNGIRWSDGSFELRQATNSFKSTISSQIKTVSAGAGTSYTAALEIATMFTPRPQQVIFLSDGQPNDDRYIDHLNQLAAEGIRIDTIGLDIGGDTAAILGQIADATEGILKLVSE